MPSRPSDIFDPCSGYCYGNPPTANHILDLIDILRNPGMVSSNDDVEHSDEDGEKARLLAALAKLDAKKEKKKRASRDDQKYKLAPMSVLGKFSSTPAAATKSPSSTILHEKGRQFPQRASSKQHDSDDDNEYERSVDSPAKVNKRDNSKQPDSPAQQDILSGDGSSDVDAKATADLRNLVDAEARTQSRDLVDAKTRTDSRNLADTQALAEAITTLPTEVYQETLSMAECMRKAGVAEDIVLNAVRDKVMGSLRGQVRRQEVVRDDEDSDGRERREEEEEEESTDSESEHAEEDVRIDDEASSSDDGEDEEDDEDNMKFSGPRKQLQKLLWTVNKQEDKKAKKLTNKMLGGKEEISEVARKKSTATPSALPAQSYSTRSKRLDVDDLLEVRYGRNDDGGKMNGKKEKEKTEVNKCVHFKVEAEDEVDNVDAGKQILDLDAILGSAWRGAADDVQKGKVDGAYCLRGGKAKLEEHRKKGSDTKGGKKGSKGGEKEGGKHFVKVVEDEDQEDRDYGRHGEEPEVGHEGKKGKKSTSRVSVTDEGNGTDLDELDLR